MPIYPAQGPAGPPGASSSVYEYTLSTSNTPPPGLNKIATNATGAPSATLMYVSYTPTGTGDIAPLLRTIVLDDVLTVSDKADSSKYAEWKVSGAVTDNTVDKYVTIPITWTAGSGTLGKNNQSVNLFHQLHGSVGPQGPPGPPGSLSTSDKWATAQNFPYTVGRYYDGLIGITYATNQNFGANALNLNPIYWHFDINVDQIGVNVTQAGTGYIRLAVYNCDPVTGLPTTLKFETANILANSTGAKTAAITQSFTAGWYYVALNSDSSIFLMGATYTATTVRYGFSAVADTYAGGGFTRTQTFGAMPTPAAMTTANITPFSYIPSVRFRIAA